MFVVVPVMLMQVLHVLWLFNCCCCCSLHGLVILHLLLHCVFCGVVI